MVKNLPSAAFLKKSGGFYTAFVREKKIILISGQKVGSSLGKLRDLTVLMSQFVQRQSQCTLIVPFAVQLQV
jgi:hypothetical protein